MDSNAASCRAAARRRTVRRMMTRGLLVLGASVGITAAAWALSSASASAEESPAPLPQVPGIENLADTVNQFLAPQPAGPVDEINKVGGAIRDGIAEHLPPNATPGLPIWPGTPSATPVSPKPGPGQHAAVFAPRVPP